VKNTTIREKRIRRYDFSESLPNDRSKGNQEAFRRGLREQAETPRRRQREAFRDS